MEKVKGVIFDMDGLLFDTEKVYIEVNVALAPKYGMHDLDEVYMLEHVGLSDALSFQKYLRDYPHMTEEKLTAFVKEGHQVVHERFSDGTTPLKPSVRELLEELKRQDIPCVVASSNLRRFIDILLREANLTHYFKAVFSAEDVTHPKPDPEIVLKAVEALGLKPEECLMLEDSFSGVRAAHAAGVPVVMVPDLMSPDDEMKAKTVAVTETLAEILAAFKK
ncbi:HAD family hydrolase [Vagococcus lutrae]|uniref:HAD family hydrolase n=1 Tax=Vagococcus lutrae TaxID=81947 RepID=UPI0028911047|nr:HAD family phosphatase [Vagococcus lutrae]MDT2842404.1 HAD family phosphatase [Vagococcus lutrae]